MAWLRELGTCVCGKPATHELMNRFNEPCGLYCPQCGAKRLKEFNKMEAAEKKHV